MKMLYLIKKNGVYIGPEYSGCVDNPELAEVFSEEFAKSLAKRDENLKAIPLNKTLASADLLIFHMKRMQKMADILKAENERMQKMVDALKADNPTGE